MNRKLKLPLIIFVFLAALFLRFYRFGKIPPGLNRDEASIGYTAYSILKTGQDEYGHFLPLSIKSFGDWKLPGYVYLTIPFVAVFGLNDWVVRLPSALVGILTIIVAYFLAMVFFKREIKKLRNGEIEGLKIKDKKSPNISISKYLNILPEIAALFLALTPWHIYFSRAGYEANLALLFFTLGVLYFIKERFIFSAIWFVFTLYTYHAYHLLTPVFLLAATIILRKKISKKRKEFLMATVLFLILAGIIFWQNLSGNLTKTSEISFMTDPFIIQDQIILPRSTFDYQFLGAIFYNKVTVFGKIFLNNYLASFSPAFMVWQGGRHPIHNAPGIGHLLLIQYLFFLIGFYYLFKERKNKNNLLLMAWILLSPLASSMTKDAPNSVRLTPLIVPVNLVAGLGFCRLFNKIKSEKVLTTLFLVTFLLIFSNLVLFFQKYFHQLPLERGENWGAGYQELVNYLYLPENQDKKIIIEKPHYSPYIYLLFYRRYDPKKFQEEVVYYPVTEDGFYHVKSLGRFEFQEKKVGQLEKNQIGIFRRESFKEKKLYFFVSELKKIIFAESEQPAFYIFEKTK